MTTTTEGRCKQVHDLCRSRVVDILTQDHHDVLDLIEVIGSSTDAQQRRDLADTVTAELVRHSVTEAMFVYPAIWVELEHGTAIVQRDILDTRGSRSR